MADAAGVARTKEEQELADMTAESMMLGPIPIIWQFGTQIGSSLKQGVESVFAPSETRLARRAAQDAVSAAERREERDLQFRQACIKGNWRKIVDLRSKGVDVNLRNAKDWQRWAPLHYAVAYGRVTATETLLDLGAQVNMQDWDQWTPLHWAAYLGEPGHVKIAQVLVAKGAHLHETTWNGQTPRDLSLKYQHHEMAELLQRAEDAAWGKLPWWRRPRKARVSRTGMRKDRKSFLKDLAAKSFDPRLRALNQEAKVELEQEALAMAAGTSGLVIPDTAETRLAADRAAKIA